jgi:TldD protein
MNTVLDSARVALLEPAGLDEASLVRVLAVLTAHGADDADVYLQLKLSESWSLEDGRIKEGAASASRGAGLRTLKAEAAGLAWSNDLTLPALLDAAASARGIASAGIAATRPAAARRTTPAALYPAINPLDSMGTADKLDVLRQVDARARASDARITQVMASLAAVHEVVLVARADGLIATDVRPLVRLSVSVIAEQGGRREQASSGGGARLGLAHVMDASRWQAWTDEAVRRALTLLEAVPAPAGSQTVVLGPGWPGVLLHEAVGHGLEGDFNRKGTSAYAGRIGQRVAAPGVTVVDDGTLPQRRGSLTVDDEGTPTQRTVLIEDGILKAYMQDRLNARLMGVVPTGNGRRESYAHLPMPRMTNTCMLAGTLDPAEIIASVERGLYAAQFGGGQVDITSGKFVFAATEAYLIENGRLTRPVKGATLIGNGPDVLTRVSLIGHDMQLDDGVGTCGKDGQSVPVGVGQPTLRIDGLTVGGTAL